jgi:hypothetical protein
MNLEPNNEVIKSEEIVTHGTKYLYETLSNGEKRLRHYDEKYKMWVIIKESPDAVSLKEMEKVLKPQLKSMYYDYLKKNNPKSYESFGLAKYHY